MDAFAVEGYDGHLCLRNHSSYKLVLGTHFSVSQVGWVSCRSAKKHTPPQIIKQCQPGSGWHLMSAARPCYPQPRKAFSTVHLSTFGRRQTWLVRIPLDLCVKVHVLCDRVWVFAVRVDMHCAHVCLLLHICASDLPLLKYNQHAICLTRVHTVDLQNSRCRDLWAAEACLVQTGCSYTHVRAFITCMFLCSWLALLRLEFITDVEGNWDYFLTYIEQSQILHWNKDWHCSSVIGVGPLSDVLPSMFTLLLVRPSDSTTILVFLCLCVPHVLPTQFCFYAPSPSPSTLPSLPLPPPPPSFPPPPLSALPLICFYGCLELCSCILDCKVSHDAYKMHLNLL